MLNTKLRLDEQVEKEKKKNDGKQKKELTEKISTAIRDLTIAAEKKVQENVPNKNIQRQQNEYQAMIEKQSKAVNSRGPGLSDFELKKDGHGHGGKPKNTHGHDKGAAGGKNPLANTLFKGMMGLPAGKGKPPPGPGNGGSIEMTRRKSSLAPIPEDGNASAGSGALGNILDPDTIDIETYRSNQALIKKPPSNDLSGHDTPFDKHEGGSRRKKRRQLPPAGHKKPGPLIMQPPFSEQDEGGSFSSSFYYCLPMVEEI